MDKALNSLKIIQIHKILKWNRNHMRAILNIIKVKLINKLKSQINNFKKIIILIIK